MSAFMSDRTPEERRYFRLQMLVYDILRAEDGGKLAAPQMVDKFVDDILALDPKAPGPNRIEELEAENARLADMVQRFTRAGA